MRFPDPAGGLTNAIKHAGPARATVRVRWASDALELEIADDGHGSRGADEERGGQGITSGQSIANHRDATSGHGIANGAGTTSGHGIAGMRERAALHGGSIHAGPGPNGGFVVLANLPLAAEGVR